MHPDGNLTKLMPDPGGGGYSPLGYSEGVGTPGKGPLVIIFLLFFLMNICLSIVVFAMRPQSLKMTIHLLYRAYDGSKLDVGCRRQQPNIREKGSSTSTSPLLDQTHRSSLIFLKVCLGMQT